MPSEASGLAWNRSAVAGKESSLTRTEEFARLLEAAREGSPSAFAALVSPHRTRMLALLRLRLPDALRHLVDPEDLLQESLMKAFRGFDGTSCDDPVALRAWLLRIAANVARESGRRQLGTVKRGEGREIALSTRREGMLAAGTGALTRLRRRERLERLEAALRTLSDEHREVILLSRIEGLPLAVVARRMERTPVAVSGLLLRALAKLRAAFGDTESFTLPLVDRSRRATRQGEGP